MYNASTESVLNFDGDKWLWAAKGRIAMKILSFPCVVADVLIVSLGVAHIRTNGIEYLGIATGTNYALLNTTQRSMAYSRSPRIETSQSAQGLKMSQ